MGKLSVFIKDNIQIKPTKLGLNRSNQLNLPITLYIQVPSKFFYEWLEEHYVKLLKVALTKELGKKRSYFIKLRWKTLMAINNRLRNNCQVPMGSNETTKCRCSFKI
jgi:chromosomal replication initiation ATPase DnaA